MKHQNKIISILLGGTLLTSLVLLTPNKNVNKVEAYDKTTNSTLAKNINLNDLSDNDIRNYYSNLNSLSETERQGDNLLKNLKGILKNGQKYFAYENNETVWRTYEIIDRDWKLSPASEIEGYDASTNTISGYTYHKSGVDPYVHALYVDRSVTNTMTAWKNHNQTAWGINREHIWPKSQGFEDEGSGGARGDLLHLWAADGKANWLHNAYSYGYVDKDKTVTKLTTTAETDPNYQNDEFYYVRNNIRGTSKTLGSGTVFEPQDSDKGDIARALFYMAARYNNFDGDTAIDSDNPNLRLTNVIATTSGYQSSTSIIGEYGILSDLLEWNKLDPVDEFELHRNNLCYNNYTNNRNPFIDFPEWADLIWGADKTTKSANPASDDIARPQDFVPPTEDTAKKDDGNIIPGVPNLYFFIACGVVGLVVLIVIIVIMTKGSKKQKKALKKIGKKVVKSQTKSKKRK